MMEERYSNLLFGTCLVGLLLGAVGTVYFLAGLAGYVHSPLLNSSIAVVLAGSLAFFFYHFFAAARETNWLGRAIWLLILFILVAEAALGLVPPTARDELTHHLAIPRLYVQAGRIIEVPIAPYSYYPMLLDMLFTPWLYWGLDFAPKLVHGFFGLLTGFLIYAYLSRRMNAVYGLLGFFFYISIPAVLRLSHWAYVDLGITFYSTAALLCLLRWREEKGANRWLIFSALSAGFAVSTKPNGLVVLLLVSFLFAFALANEPKRGLAKIGSEIVVFGGFALLPFLPWLSKNYVQTGNPFFPHFAGLFPRQGGVGRIVEAAQSYAEMGIFARRQLLYGESGWEIAGLPLRLFFLGQDDRPQYFDGVLSPILILLLPWAFKGKWGEEKKILFSFAVLFLAYAIFLVDLRVRYILVIVPPLVALLGYAVFNIYLRLKRPAYLFGGLIFFAGVHLTYLYHHFREVAPVGYVLGHENREAYLTERLGEYPAFQYVNRETPSTAKIYLLFVGRRAYYCERDYFHDGGELPGALIAAIRSAKEPADIARRLKETHLTHLLVREDLLIRFLGDNLTPPQQSLWNRFALNHLESLFRDRGYSVLRMHG
ncbi:MAG: ArnT family glycosyltransferase [Candidatus Binatia bacterium]